MSGPSLPMWAAGPPSDPLPRDDLGRVCGGALAPAPPARPARCECLPPGRLGVVGGGVSAPTPPARAAQCGPCVGDGLGTRAAGPWPRRRQARPALERA